MSGTDTGAATARHEVVVVGAGQAGLALGFFLQRQARDFVILEAGHRPGAAWHARWDSLRLFTPVRRDGLPGRPFPGDPDAYPGRDDVVAYLQDYARELALPVELDSRVTAVRPRDGGYLVELGDRAVRAEQVVVATGSFQVPVVPRIAEQLDPDVVQLHSSRYRAPAQLPPGPALVVGGGNTGFQIAEELARGREVHLSIGSRQTPLPQRILGRDLFTYLEAIGVMRVPVTSRVGRRLQQRETLIGSSPWAARRRHGVHLHRRAVDAVGREVRFADGGAVTPAAVVWATGFRLDLSMIQAPVFGPDGELRHERGATAAPGLYVLGLPWQHTRGSALLGWIHDDAEFIAGRIADHARRRGRTPDLEDAPRR